MLGCPGGSVACRSPLMWDLCHIKGDFKGKGSRSAGMTIGSFRLVVSWNLIFLQSFRSGIALIAITRQRSPLITSVAPMLCVRSRAGMTEHFVLSALNCGTEWEVMTQKMPSSLWPCWKNGLRGFLVTPVRGSALSFFLWLTVYIKFIFSFGCPFFLL